MKKEAKSHFKPIKILLLISGLLILGLALFIFYAYLRLFVFDIEQRDFDLYDKFKIVAEKVESYKLEHGSYPVELSVVSGDEICVRKYINFCTKIKYEVRPDDTGFRMATKSLSWPIFYYHSDYSKNTIHTNWAYPPGTTPDEYKTFPVYKETSPIFGNPEEWPDL